MCFTTEGKYIVDGKEIDIDDDVDEIPINVLKKLEANPMTQLDAFYIRKRINQLSKSFVKSLQAIDDEVIKVNKRVDSSESKLENFTQNEFECQAKRVPEIAESVVHKVVNGKFNKIADTLANISSEQLRAKQELIKYKEFQISQQEIIIQKIDYVAEKTIFGSIKKQYEKRPLRTIIIFGVLVGILFLYFMNTLGFHSFSDMLKWIMDWFK